jgi:hypothetical protein
MERKGAQARLLPFHIATAVRGGHALVTDGWACGEFVRRLA